MKSGGGEKWSPLGQSGPLLWSRDWHSDRPGLSRIIRPDDLPKPGATPSISNFPHVVPRVANAVPPGFKVELFAEGLSGPREMRVAPNGDIFVAETHAGRIRVLRAGDGDSKPSINEIFASGLNQPFGIFALQ
jgi:glucose/arabinose dehydrogenase